MKIKKSYIFTLIIILIFGTFTMNGCGRKSSSGSAGSKESSETSSEADSRAAEELQKKSDKIFSSLEVYGKDDAGEIDDYVKENAVPDDITLQNFYYSVNQDGLKRGALAVRDVQEDYGELKLYVSYDGKKYFGYKSIEVYDDDSQNEVKTGEFKYLYQYSDLVNAADKHDFIPSGESFFLTDMKPVKAYEYITDYESRNDGAEPENKKVLYLMGYDA